MNRTEVVAAARGWIGTPYRHRAALRGAGCDCLGLVRGVWRDLGGADVCLPNYRADWRDLRHADELLELAQSHLQPAQAGPVAGQVMLFRLGPSVLPRHCGIALDGGRFVHAQEGLGVVEANLTEGWRKRIAGLFDFPGV
jgi:NlpC/P60 family putative phage cell wall peptidase